MATQQFEIANITAPADVGAYTILSTATIPQNAFSTNTVLTTSYSFTLTVQSDCLNTVITERTITNMSNKVSLAAVTQDVNFLDSISTLRSDSTYCGTKTYSLSPIHSFLTISGSTISLATASVGDVGSFNVALTVSLASYAGITSITKNFVVTITCEVQNLTFSTAPASITLQVGIDTQPFNIAYVISQTPACANVVTFSLSPTSTFLSLSTLTSTTGGNV